MEGSGMSEVLKCLSSRSWNTQAAITRPIHAQIQAFSLLARPKPVLFEPRKYPGHIDICGNKTLVRASSQKPLAKAFARRHARKQALQSQNLCEWCGGGKMTQQLQ
jgi:hypothetical protein